MRQSWPVDWVDAFTDQPFGGNACAVVHDGGALEGATCMALARETSLTECTFVGPSKVADARVRYFLTDREIPFAGHPTIATTASLLARGLVAGPDVRLETLGGVIPVIVSVEDGRWSFTITQPAPTFGAGVASETIARVSRIDVEDIIAPPQIVSCGLPYPVTLVRDPDVLAKAGLDTGAYQAELAPLSHPHGQPFEPFLIALDGTTLHARHLMVPPGPPEDAFTGSAMGPVGAYLWKSQLINDPQFKATQGQSMGRPGLAEVEVLGDRDDITGIKVTGSAHLLMTGELML